MATFVLLRGQGFHQGYALYRDGELVANFSHQDYDWYIESQIASRMSEGDDLKERNWSKPFPQALTDEGKPAEVSIGPVRRKSAD